MKALKILLKVILGIVVLVIVALLALPLWFGPVAKSVANAATPKVVKADFHLGHLSLNPYTARFQLGDMQLSNPEGYSEKYAVTLGDIVFDAETLSLMTDVIHIEELTVKDLFASVVSGGENKVDNYVQFQYNVAGGKDKYEAAQAAKKAEEAQKKPEEEGEKGPAKKIIIDRLLISGIKIKYGILPISVPVDIELRDIGRKSGGATAWEACQEIWNGILKAAGISGDQLKALGDLTGEAAKKATEVVNKATEQVAEAAAKATESVGKVTESVGQAAEGATKAVGDVAGQAAEGATKAVGQAASAVTDTASKATEGAAKAVGGATKAVGEGATKALDSLKKLW